MLPVVGVWGIEEGADQLICEFEQLGYTVIRDNRPAGYKQVPILFIWLDLPIRENGHTDVTELWIAVREMAEHLPNRASIVLKSLLPVGTGDAVQAWLYQNKKAIEVMVCSDWTQDKCSVILGGGRNSTLRDLRKLLSKICLPILVTSRKEAEFITYATRAFLATKRSFINQLLPFCDEHKIDVQTVARALGVDPRIGQAYLSAGIHVEDQEIVEALKSLIFQGKELKASFPLLEAVQEVYDQTSSKVLVQTRNVADPLKGKTVAIWAGGARSIGRGKRHIPVLKIVDELFREQCRVRLFDPFGEICWEAMYDSRLERTKAPCDAAQHADLLLILESHPTLAAVDLHYLKKSLKTPLVIDAAYLFPKELMQSYGFAYFSVGGKVRT